MSDIFDPFFAATAAVVSLLVALDWLIGKNGRRAMKERVGDFWTVVQDRPVAELFLDACAGLRRLLDYVIGTSFVSPRFLAGAAGINVLLTFGFFHPVDQAPSIVVTIAIVSGWVSFAILSWALRMDADAGATWTQALVLFLRSIVGVVATTVAAGTVLFGYSSVGGRIGGDLGAAFEIISFAGDTFLYSLWPIALGVLIIVALVLLKLSQPVIKPVLSLILERLYESERGILTQLSIGLGAAVKLVQELLE